MIYCFDLDGTLCTNTNGRYLEAIPYLDRIKKVNELYSSGNTIIIDSARGYTTGVNWTVLTEIQLENWGLKYSNLIVGKKPYADIFIDDKAIIDEEFFKN